jgi:hypothetical protein
MQASAIAVITVWANLKRLTDIGFVHSYGKRLRM